MSGRRLDEINLQKIGMSMRNIVMLRNVESIVAGAVLNTDDLEKYTFSLHGDTDSLRERLNQLERLVLLQSEPAPQPQKDDRLIALVADVNARLDAFESKLANLEKALWLLISP